MKFVKCKYTSRKSKVLITGLIAALGLGIISESAAAFNNTFSRLDDSVSHIKDAQTNAYVASNTSVFDIESYLEYIRSGQEFYKQIVGAKNNLSDLLKGNIVATGKLGIPIPKEIQTAINKATNQTENQKGGFGMESVLLNKVLKGETDYETALARAEIILSKEGQQQIFDTKQMNQKASIASASASQIAQKQNVTQDVLKQTAIQNAANTAILRSVYNSVVENQVTNTQVAQATGNISKTLASEAWSKQVNVQVGQIGIMDTTAQFSALVSPENN